MRKYPPIEARFWARVDKRGDNECWNWTASLSHGYGQIGKNSFNEKLAHRLSYAMANGPIQNGMSVLHKCDNPKCVNPSHLWLGTRADNVADCKSKGRNKSGRFPGSHHPNARLSDDDVLAIRASNSRLSDIAGSFGITTSHASQIRQRHIWKHL